MERRHWDARTPKTGERAPDFQVLDEAGKRTTLSKLSNGGPLVLLFIRSHQEPVCLRQLLDYRDATLSFSLLGARIACVSAEGPSLLAFFRRERGIGFPMVSDEGGHVAESLGLLDPRDHGGVAHPATFVLDRDLTVRQRVLDSLARRTPADEMLRLVRRGGAAPKSVLSTAGVGPRLHRLVQAVQHAFRPARLVR